MKDRKLQLILQLLHFLFFSLILLVEVAFYSVLIYFQLKS